jgi:hypothetical protein
MLSTGLWRWYINITITILDGLENRDYGPRDPSRWPRGTPYPHKLALTSLISGGRSVGIVRSPTKATVIIITILDIIHCPVFYLKQNVRGQDG